MNRALRKDVGCIVAVIWQMKLVMVETMVETMVDVSVSKDFGMRLGTWTR